MTSSCDVGRVTYHVGRVTYQHHYVIMTREVPKCPFYYHQLYCHTQCVSDMVHSPPSCAQGACSDLLILLTLQKSVRCSELNKED